MKNYRQDDLPVRIAWLTPYVPPYRVSLMNQLGNRKDVELQVYTGRPINGSGSSDAVAQLTCSCSYLTNINIGRTGRVLYVQHWTRILESRPDVLLITEASHNLSNWCLALRGRMTGVKIVVVGHICLPSNSTLWRRALRRVLLYAANGVLAYTDAGRLQAEKWGISGKRLGVLHNALDIQQIKLARGRQTESRINRLRTVLEIRNDCRVALFVGRLSPQKRIEVAIDTMRRLDECGANLILIVVGDGIKREEYREMYSGVGNLRFVGEVHDEDELALYFAIADITFIPGAVGLGAYHSFAYGVPLLTSREASHGPEIALAEHGRNAWIVDACRATLFRDSLLYLLWERSDLLASLKAGASDTRLPTTLDAASNIARLVHELRRNNRKHEPVI